jgi:hypothetical protein
MQCRAGRVDSRLVEVVDEAAADDRLSERQLVYARLLGTAEELLADAPPAVLSRCSSLAASREGAAMLAAAPHGREALERTIDLLLDAAAVGLPVEAVDELLGALRDTSVELARSGDAALERLGAGVAIAADRAIDRRPWQSDAGGTDRYRDG